ncbi:PQQ-like beta-propeller repeat protein, partial [candidate division TA06 bacterium]|nr:PQQ-like beta-propeller repeat protein [candidate division TA06 bacterium]
GGWWLYDAPTIGPDGTIYILSENGYLYSFTSTGSLLWQYFIGVGGGTYRGSTSFSIEDSSLYTGGIDGNLYSLTPEGTLKWTFSTGGRINAAPAIGIDGTIYFGSDDSTFYALYPNGTLKWSFPVLGK